MSDTDLRELERQTQRTPDDAGAWLALARAQARVGARDEALAGFYRAAALGGDLTETRAGLRALGAAASPWSHPDGDAGRSRCSPLVGPRRGEIVARAPLGRATRVVVAGDGVVVVAQHDGSLSRFEGRSLSPLPAVGFARATRVEGLAAGADVVVATTDSSLYRVSGARAANVGLVGTDRRLSQPVVVGDRAAILVSELLGGASRVSVRTLPSLEEAHAFRTVESWLELAGDAELLLVPEEGRTGERFVRIHDWTGAERGVVGMEGLAVDVRLARDRILSVFARALVEPRSGVFGYEVAAWDRSGAALWTCTVETSGPEPHVAATGDGGCYVVSTDERLRIGPDGRVAWRHAGRHSRRAICDRDGVLYCVEEGEPHVLRAIDVEGRELFQVSHAVHAFEPCAIDAWNRLLAVFTHESLQGEIVAIA